MKFVIIFSIIAALLLIPFTSEAQLRFPDGTEQSTAAKDSEITIVSNVTELRAAVALGGVIYLTPGLYSLGNETLTLVEGTDLIGSNPGYFVGSLGCVIRGGGANPVISGANAVRIHRVVIDSPNFNTTLVNMVGDGEGTMVLRDIRMVSWINTGVVGTNIGLQVTNGNHVKVENCEIETLDTDGNVAAGTYIGIEITGESSGSEVSSVDLINSEISADDETGMQTLIGVRVGDGTVVSGETPDFNAPESEIVISGGSSATALIIASDGFVSSRGTFFASDGIVLSNAGMAYLFGAIFEGARVTTGTTFYTHCSSLEVAGPTPIINTIATAIP